MGERTAEPTRWVQAALLPGSLRDLLLDPLDHPLLVARAVERVHLLAPGRAGHVHLGQAAADHVDADEEEPIAREPRPEALDDAPIVGIERGLLGAPAHVEVRARLPLRRNAQHGAERLALEQQDALVAASH